MNKQFKILITISILFIFTNCSKEYEVPDDLVKRDFVWKGLNAYYLHQDKIEDLSDRRFNSDQEVNAYLQTFANEITLFSSLLFATDTKSTIVADYNTLFDEIPLRTSFTNGLEFGIILDPSNNNDDEVEKVIGYVTHILPNSDAASKSIMRGDFFNVVDGEQLTRANYLSLLVNGAETFTLGMINFDGITSTPTSTTAELTKTMHNYEPIFLEKTIVSGANTIGYLAYNNDFSSNYISDINDSFLNFKTAGINQLVLDFRYNIGGGSFAKNVSQLAAMITNQTPDKVVIKEQWNTKAQPWFLANQPDSLLTRFSTQLDSSIPINSIGVTDVYIILNGDNYAGSSAIELLINSLKPYINVHLIGNQTTGNNTGAITLYNSLDYNFANRSLSHTVALQPIVLEFLNSNDETYENGFTPNITLCTNEDLLNLGILGANSDGILKQVLDFIDSGSFPITTPCNPSDFQYLYNSIEEQREIDNGVFIKQQLPNTN